MAGSREREVSWTLPAVPVTVAELRTHVLAFAESAGASAEVRRAVGLAVSEAVTNVVVHAYAGGGGLVRVVCRAAGGRLIVEVADNGTGLGSRDDSPGIGQGLAMVGRLADALEVRGGAGGRGTVITMEFGAAEAPAAPLGVEVLCTLALDAIADVSCVDFVRGGVLRRAAAEVAGDAALSAWLLTATPPVKPGTATWEALREGGARLVVHDPGVPRSPGGTGEVLGLQWWVAVPLEGSDGSPAALWGFGGRAGGHAVPSGDVLDALSVAAREDLADPRRREALRQRLSALSQSP